MSRRSSTRPPGVGPSAERPVPTDSLEPWHEPPALLLDINGDNPLASFNIVPPRRAQHRHDDDIRAAMEGSTSTNATMGVSQSLNGSAEEPRDEPPPTVPTLALPRPPRPPELYLS